MHGRSSSVLHGVESAGAVPVTRMPLSSALLAVYGVLWVEGPAEEESPGTGISEWGLGTEAGDEPEILAGEAEEVGTPCTTGTPPRLRPWTDHSPAQALDGLGPVRLTNLLQGRRAAFGELPLCAAEKSGMRCAAHAVRCTGRYMRRHCCRRLLLSRIGVEGHLMLSV